MIIGSGKPKKGRPKNGSYRQGRDCKLCIRLSSNDLRKLNKLCDIYSITKADFIIKSINDALREVMKRGY